jgi:cytochrome c553
MRLSPLCLLAFGLASASAFAQDAATAGAPAFVTKPGGCATCHGANGASIGPTFPNLAGQQRSYIEHVLHAYKDGERKNPVMSMQVANLSDADIAAAALWFSQQPAKVYVPAVDAKK